MRKILRFVIVAVVIVGGSKAYMQVSTSDARDMGRSFMFSFSSGDIDSAYSMFHSAYKSGMPKDQFATAVAGAKPYNHVSFPRASKNSDAPTEISGKANTADGCESAVKFMFVDDKIYWFNIEPLCRE